MNDFSRMVTAFVDSRALSESSSGDYCDGEGLLRCGVCGERKEIRADAPFEGRKLRCTCACESERYAREALEDNLRRESIDIRTRKERCFLHREQWRHTFETDDGGQEKMNIIRDYCTRWSEMKEKNIGLLLTGGIGTGKTFAAECIANRLCETGTYVKMASLSEALNAIGAASDKNSAVRELTQYSLLIIDDFRLERGSEFALESTLNLIDSRYRSGKPLIITTNLSYVEIKECSGGAAQRICDRILEMCVPVSFKGPDRRSEAGKLKAETLASKPESPAAEVRE